MTALNCIDSLSSENLRIQSQWLGVIDYLEVDQLQKQLKGSVRGQYSQIVLGQEMHPIITLGRRSKTESRDVLWTAADLQKQGIRVVTTDRGGQATLHSPGQLVIYPILDLQTWQWSVQDYVLRLLVTTSYLLQKYGILSRVDLCQPGVYTEQGKIAFCGLRIDQGISQHGLALNISNDLSLFSSIVPCGFKQQALDKVENYVDKSKLSQHLTPQIVFKDWVSIWQHLATVHIDSLPQSCYSNSR